MMNFRTIFNQSYSLIGLMIILFLLLLIFIINHNFSESCHNIGKSSIIAGFITLILSFLINIIINSMIPNKYKIFISVISNNLMKNFIFYSVIAITIGIIFLIISKVFLKKEDS